MGNNEHKESTYTVLPAQELPVNRKPLWVFIAFAACSIMYGMFSWPSSRSTAHADKLHAGAAQAETTCVETDKLQVQLHEVKPTGLDNSACVKLPYDGSGCKPSQVGQKIVKDLDGKYRRITCGHCLRFTYPTNINSTVEITVEEGGAQ